MMNIDLSRTSSQVIFQSVRSVATIVGLGGIVVVFIESGTGTFFETFDRLAQASDILTGMIG